MHEQVIISHRGARYEIGRGTGFYGIWPAGAAHLQPIEWWPETAAGWQDAWSRFTDVEARRTIVQVTRPAAPADQHAPDQHPAPADQHPAPADQHPVPADQHPASADQSPASAPNRASRTKLANRGRRSLTAAGLLAVGVGVGFAGLFPGYFGGTSLTAQASELVPHLIYLAAWAASAVMIMLGGNRARAGALLGAGTSVVTFGLYLADAGTAITGGAHLVGTGLVLGLIGWVACSAGAAVGLWLGPVGAPRRPRGTETTLTVVLAGVAALGTAIAFAPSWDRFTLRTAAGVTQSLTAGNAFANPGLVIAGDVACMAALVAVVIAAAAWRPVRQGAFLLAGAIVPMAAQAISALIQAAGTASPLQFGITPTQAARAGLTISSGLTPAFWIYCVFVVALALTCALVFATPAPPPPPPAPARPAAPNPVSAAPATQATVLDAPSSAAQTTS